MANKKYKLTDGNMWATDGIHDFGQNKTQRTINSEVNTALGGKAPKNHASTSTTYGKGTRSNYGHVKISDSLTDTTPAATGGVVPSMKAVSDLNGAISQLDSDDIANASQVVGGAKVTNALETLNGAITSVQGQICAFVETGNNATRAYGEGGYLVWKGVLYKVTSFIPSGTAFNSGTGGNITAVTLGSELYKINRDSGWITLYDSNPQYIKYRRIGDVLYINGSLNSDGTRYVPVATLPTGYRPTVRQTTSIDFTNDPIVNAYINIGTDGSIALVNWDETAATNLFFHISFPL